MVPKTEKYSIQHSMVISFNQTPLKLVSYGKNALAKKNSSAVTIAAAADKRSVTGTFSITLSREFLPMELIYGEKRCKVSLDANFRKVFP